MNLCTNAAHAMGDKPGRLMVTLEKFEVDEHLAASRPGWRSGPYVRLSVGDTGSGMDEVTLNRMFEPFFTTKAPGQGTGLGLAVVHGIMQSHEGAVTVYSHLGEGTIFRLYFPIYAGDKIAEDATASVAPWGQGERILYVDDEPPLVKVGRAILEKLSYRVETRTNAIEALALVRQNPQAFDLVITDQMMPAMTGTTLAANIHTLRGDLPIMLITGYSATLTAESVRSVGIQKLLLKPLTFDALGSAVADVLKNRPA
jgi:CheY-like chemotaxis protein